MVRTINKFSLVESFVFNNFNKYDIYIYIYKIFLARTFENYFVLNTSQWHGATFLVPSKSFSLQIGSDTTLTTNIFYEVFLNHHTHLFIFSYKSNSTILNIDLATIFLPFKITYLLILSLAHKYEYGRIKGQNSKDFNFVKCGVWFN